MGDSRMSIRDVFITAVRRCPNLPESARDAGAVVEGIEETIFDATYLDFLDEQIQLNARGDAWSDRLRRRRAGLADWCDRPLIFGRVLVDADEYCVRVDPQTNEVVYWEVYADINAQ